MSQETLFWVNKKGQQKKTVYEGQKNKTEFKFFIEICKASQRILKDYLFEKLSDYYNEIISDDGYIYAKGTCPILLTAHMDTVHKELVKDFYDKKFYNKTRKRYEHKISSPQGIGGDDRCGIYMILRILMETDFRPTILFCEDEEIGGVGSNKFVQNKELVNEISNLKYFVELDRANAYDAVFYDCGNKEFKKYVETFGFEEDYGSFSDISHLSPKADVASVNLSCGYYEAHTVGEYVIMEEMEDTIEKVKEMLSDAENAKAYDYQEETYYSYGSYWDSYVYGDSSTKYSAMYCGVEITYTSKDNKIEYDAYCCESEDDLIKAFGQFFMDHPDICWNDVMDYELY